MNSVSQSRLCEPGEDLSQGDIFISHLVAPYATPQVRILRGAEGRTGVDALQGRAAAQVLTLDDFADADRHSERIPPPFSLPDGELVVVFGDLLEYFVLASQTCDVSGPGRKDFLTVLPVRPFAHVLTDEPLPLPRAADPRNDAPQSVCQFLAAVLGAPLEDNRADIFGLPRRVDELIEPKWQNQPEEVKAARGRIKVRLKALRDDSPQYTYYIPAVESLNVPESFIDFTRPHTVDRETLMGLSARRVAAMPSPHRELFSQRFGLYLFRVAAP